MTNMKRCLSDSENDDLYDEDDMKGSPTQSCQVSDRKKRRGVIEKRRRDRINSSLTELRRLVPAAFEKQGSAKLEKAEILQMTVDHLKTLHAKGINGYNLDTAALAMDYRSVGFREAAAEVARYLVAVEGMDIQDPMRLRLLSHLQCYSAQREAAAKASFQNTPWNHMASHHSLNATYNGAAMGSMAAHAPAMIGAHNNSQSEQLSMASSHAAGLTASAYTSEASRMTHHTESSHVTASMAASMRLPGPGNMSAQVPSVSSSVTSQVTAPVFSGLAQVHSQFPVSLGMNSVPMLSPSGHYSSSSLQASVKPYRPWGAELAY